MNFSFGGCTEGIEYFINPATLNFVDAQAACLGEGGKLAIPFSDDRVTQMNLLLEDEISVFVGLQDLTESGSLSGRDFLDIDGQINAFTFLAGQSQGIWASGQPDNDSASEFCVVMVDSELQDVDCDLSLPSICQRFCESPTFLDTDFDGCLDGKELYIRGDDVATSFDEAQAHCQSVDETGNLATPISETELARIFAFFNDKTEIFNTNCYLGYRDFQESGSATSTDSFISVLTGEVETFTNVGQSNFPWFEGEPNILNQICVEMRFEDGEFFDTICSRSRLYMCERSCFVLVESSEEVFVILGAGIGICALFALVALAVVHRRRKKEKAAELDDVKEKLSNYPDASTKHGKVTPGNSKYHASGGLENLELQSSLPLTTPSISSSPVPSFTPNIVTSTPIVASLSQKDKVEEVDEDVLALDAIVTANTKPKQVAVYPEPDAARPESAYLNTAQLKPEGHRSIFAPSPEFINNAAEAKAKKAQITSSPNALNHPPKEDKLDI